MRISSFFLYQGTHASFAQRLTATTSRSRHTIIFMAIAVASYEEEAVSVSCDSHSAHPDTTFTASTTLTPNIGLRCERPRFDSKICDNGFQIDVDTYDNSGVVKKITVTAERPVDNGTNLG